MSDLPLRPPQGTPEVERKIRQPEDEIPDIFMKDGRLTSKNPTEPKQRAQFELDEIRSTFNPRPLFDAANEFHKRNDLDGFVNCIKNAQLDITVMGRTVVIVLNPGDK